MNEEDDGFRTTIWIISINYSTVVYIIEVFDQLLMLEGIPHCLKSIVIFFVFRFINLKVQRSNFCWPLNPLYILPPGFCPSEIMDNDQFKSTLPICSSLSIRFFIFIFSTAKLFFWPLKPFFLSNFWKLWLVI